MKILGAFILLLVAMPSWAGFIGYSVRESDQALVTIDLATGTITEIGITDPDPATSLDDIDGLAFDSWGTLYGSDNDTDTLYTINTSTGVKTAVGAFSQGISNSGMSFDSADSLYLSEDDSESLFTVNTTTAALTSVGNHGFDIAGIAFDGSDILYGIDDSNNELVTLNTSTGLATAVGALGISTSQSQGLDFDSMGTLYMIDEGTESLYSINTSTGAASFIADLGADFESLAIVEVPEPGMLALLGIGLAGMGLTRRRRKATTV